jgi:hypothetical protein
MDGVLNIEVFEKMGHDLLCLRLSELEKERDFLSQQVTSLTHALSLRRLENVSFDQQHAYEKQIKEMALLIKALKEELAQCSPSSSSKIPISCSILKT